MVPERDTFGKRIARGQPASEREDRLGRKYGGAAQALGTTIQCSTAHLETLEAIERINPLKAADLLPSVICGKVTIAALQEVAATERSKAEAMTLATTSFAISDILADVAARNPPAAMRVEGAVWGVTNAGLVSDSTYPLNPDSAIDPDPTDRTTWGRALASQQYGHDWALLVSPHIKASPLFGMSNKDFLFRVGYIMSIYDVTWIYCSSIYEKEAIQDYAEKYSWINSHTKKTNKNKKEKLRLILPKAN